MHKTLLALFIITLSCAALATPPKLPSDRIVLVSSPDAVGVLDRERLVDAFNYLIRAMSLDGRPMPAVVVIHVSQKAAALMGMKVTTIVQQTNLDDPQKELYYEVCLVGETSPAAYVNALQQVLEHEFTIQSTNEERAAVAVSVVKKIQDRVSVMELRAGR